MTGTADNAALKDAALADAARNAEGNPFVAILAGFFKLFEAIFGSFNDTESEYSEISPEARANVAPSRRQVGSRIAEEFIQTVGHGKLAMLALEYKDAPLTNILPFRDNAVVTSEIGHREVPTPGASSDHKGIDLVSEDRTIINTMPGVVVRSETQRDHSGQPIGYGHWVEVACIDGTRRRYAHLAEEGVPIGTILHQGDVIGTMGNSGTSSGAHLHYEWLDPKGNLLDIEINGTRYTHNQHHDEGLVSDYKGNTIAATDAATVLASRPAPEPSGNNVAFARVETSMGSAFGI